MQRVKDNPINNRLIQLYIKIFPKIEDFNMEIFYDEILVLKKSLIFKKPFLFKNHSLSYFVETPFAFWLDISLLSFQACLKWSLPHPHPRRLPWSSSRLNVPLKVLKEFCCFYWNGLGQVFRCVELFPVPLPLKFN